jgi:hypothetical protein
MVKVLLIDPKEEIIIHSVRIEDKAAAKRFNGLWRDEEADRGRILERVLIQEERVLVMSRLMEIPVPVYPVLVRKGGIRA